MIKKGHSAEVDWWALGVMICEMVAGIGNTPFYADDDNEVWLTSATGALADCQFEEM